jgi:hypothetical protein
MTHKHIINKKHSNLGRQQGVVLVVSLVFLVALTAVAAALMQNTTTDMKMSGASNEKVVAMQAAISAVDETIDNQVNVLPTNVFTQGILTFTNIAGNTEYTSAELLGATNTNAIASARVIGNDFLEELPCPRSESGSSVGTIECNFLQLRIQRAYGRDNTSNLNVDASIVQPLIATNN